MLVMWHEPDPANGIIRGYKLTYTDISFGKGLLSEVNLGGNILQYNATGLKPFRIYKFFVQAKTEEPVGRSLWGPQSAPFLSRTLPAKPSASPSQFSAMSIGATVVFLSWKAPRLTDLNGIALGYRIQFSNVSDVGVNYSLSVSNSTARLNVTNLEPHTTYIFSVFLQNNAGESQPSDSVRVKTGEAPPLAAPGNIIGLAISPRAIRLNWARPPPSVLPGVLEGYDIYFSSQEGTERHVEIADANATTEILTNLEVYTEYSITVAARTGGGIGPRGPSPSLLITTHEDVPGPPDSISTLVVSATSIQVSWLPPSNPNGVLIEYVIAYRNSSFSGNVSTTNVSAQTITLENLNEFTYYDISVASRTAVGLGLFTYTVQAQTLQAEPSGPPTITAVKDASSTALNVSWLPPASSEQNGIIVSYRIRWNKTEFGFWEKTVTVPASQMQISLTGLDEYVEYDVQVQAFTYVGPGPFSGRVRRRTLAAPSNPPSINDSSSISSTSVWLSWQPPLPQSLNGLFLRYEVGFKELEDPFASGTPEFHIAFPGPMDNTNITVTGLRK
jgi:hypothetical protein